MTPIRVLRAALKSKQRARVTVQRKAVLTFVSSRIAKRSRLRKE